MPVKRPLPTRKPPVLATVHPVPRLKVVPGGVPPFDPGPYGEEVLLVLATAHPRTTLHAWEVTLGWSSRTRGTWTATATHADPALPAYIARSSVSGAHVLERLRDSILRPTPGR